MMTNSENKKLAQIGFGAWAGFFFGILYISSSQVAESIDLVFPAIFPSILIGIFLGVVVIGVRGRVRGNIALIIGAAFVGVVPPTIGIIISIYHQELMGWLPSYLRTFLGALGIIIFYFLGPFFGAVVGGMAGRQMTKSRHA